MATNILGRFLRTELINRGLNQIEFAKQIGVSHSTIGRVIHGQIKDPSLDLLIKIANATEVDICSLIHLIRPDAFASTPSAKIVADRIEKLPRKQRELIETFLNGIAMLGNEDNGNK